MRQRLSEAKWGLLLRGTQAREKVLSVTCR